MHIYTFHTASELRISLPSWMPSGSLFPICSICLCCQFFSIVIWMSELLVWLIIRNDFVNKLTLVVHSHVTSYLTIPQNSYYISQFPQSFYKLHLINPKQMQKKTATNSIRKSYNVSMLTHLSEENRRCNALNCWMEKRLGNGIHLRFARDRLIGCRDTQGSWKTIRARLKMVTRNWLSEQRHAKQSQGISNKYERHRRRDSREDLFHIQRISE